ncbi:uncharacterized protein LOC116567926 isoform X2 [Mustela erminea]|uniref:uncharacterized protein LOC116567926 isoform X2 n=1 Tax=Mustela erminea TaxID=36723 RepID=UPI001386E424|nr:uncharacterized protein LOC116567926 isoform X2 [Mustela erminea]
MQMKSCTKKSCVHIERRWLPTSQDESPQNETDLAGTLIMDFLASRTLTGTTSNEALPGKNKCMAELLLPPEPYRPPPPVQCGQCLYQDSSLRYNPWFVLAATGKLKQGEVWGFSLLPSCQVSQPPCSGLELPRLMLPSSWKVLRCPRPHSGVSILLKDAPAHGCK